MNLKGVQLGGYRLINLLGRGGMADVWLAEQIALNRKVAIKVILEATEEADAREQVARFSREARTLASLDHVNILPIIDYGSAQGYLYLVTPFVPGGSLLELLKRSWVSQGQALDIGDNILAGLSYAHQKGIIHRDLKPGNILLRADGQAMIADFGVAKIENDNFSLTQQGMVIGSPEYMAPEQFLGNANYGSDLYSLSISLYQMFSGHVPYKGNSATEVGMRHLNDQIPLPNSRIPEPVAQVLLKSLQKKPENRFTTADNMRAALSHAKKLLTPEQLETRPRQPQIDEKVSAFPTKIIQPKLTLNKEPTIPYSDKPGQAGAPSIKPAVDTSKPAEPFSASSPQTNILTPGPILRGNKTQPDNGTVRPGELPAIRKSNPPTPKNERSEKLADRKSNSRIINNQLLTPESLGESTTGTLPVVSARKPRARQALPLKIIIGGVVLLAISVLLAVGSVVFSNKALPQFFQQNPNPPASSSVAGSATTGPVTVSTIAGTTGPAPSNNITGTASPTVSAASPTTRPPSTSVPATNSPTSGTASPTTAATTAAATTQPAPIQVPLAAANGTAAQGTVTLTGKNDGTFSVVVNMIGLGQGEHPSHIHQGSCQAEGATLYDLTPLTAGSDGTATATSVIKANLNTLKSGKYYIDVLNVNGDIFYMASCGNISF